MDTKTTKAVLEALLYKIEKQIAKEECKINLHDSTYATALINNR
jgi:hypothetical protein